MKIITAALIGAGQRGADVYADFSLRNCHEMKFAAVAEPDDKRRERFAQKHAVKESMVFSDWRDLLRQPKAADAVFICTQDSMHYEPAVCALEKGYHVFLEKPMSNVLGECLEIGRAAEQYPDRIFTVAHVLRFTPFFQKIKDIIDQGRIGNIISVQHNENVGYWHQAHSFVRGNWRKSETSSPMILAKSCHDMDILLWLIGKHCRKISSFGSLSYFTEQNAPPKVPERCLDGCAFQESCPYFAPKIYLEAMDSWQAEVLQSVVSSDQSSEGILQALREGPYGRCVFKCDNDVVDHQVATLEFEDNITAVFTMCGHTSECSRTIKIMGTAGEIRGHMEKQVIEVLPFNERNREYIILDIEKEGHGGGDYRIMKSFTGLIRRGAKSDNITSPEIAVESHIMSFAAEKSRLEKGRVVDINKFWKTHI